MNGISMMEAARRAGISRQTARTCVKKGLISSPPYSPTDILAMRVAATCLEFGGHLAERDAGDDRILAAVRLADAFVRAGMVTVTASLIVGPVHSEIAETLEDLSSAARRQHQAPFLVLPIGEWSRLILS